MLQSVLQIFIASKFTSSKEAFVRLLFLLNFLYFKKSQGKKICVYICVSSNKNLPSLTWVNETFDLLQPPKREIRGDPLP